MPIRKLKARLGRRPRLAAAAKPVARAPRRPLTKATRRPVRARWPPQPERVAAILDGLETLYPDVDCELHRETPFQLLIATILSAQTTDERVNQVTPELFRRFPTAAAMAEAPLPVLEDIIRSTGFYRQKARSLKGTATLLANASAARSRGRSTIS